MGAVARLAERVERLEAEVAELRKQLAAVKPTRSVSKAKD